MESWTWTHFFAETGGKYLGRFTKVGYVHYTRIGPIPPKNIPRRARKVCYGLIDWAHSTKERSAKKLEKCVMD